MQMTRSDDERSSVRETGCAAEQPQLVPARESLGSGGARCQLKRCVQAPQPVTQTTTRDAELGGCCAVVCL